MRKEDFPLWKHTLSVSESIAEDVASGIITKQGLLQQLQTIEEVFKKTNDPSEDFEGHVLLHLCQSIRKALDIFENSGKTKP